MAIQRSGRKLIRVAALCRQTFWADFLWPKLFVKSTWPGSWVLQTFFLLRDFCASRLASADQLFFYLLTNNERARLWLTVNFLIKLTSKRNLQMQAIGRHKGSKTLFGDEQLWASQSVVRNFFATWVVKSFPPGKVRLQTFVANNFFVQASWPGRPTFFSSRQIF